MILLLTFAALFVAGLAGNLGISILVEQFSKSASIVVFFVLLAAVAVGGWRIAVALTDRWAERRA
jgi:hypothetical protein